MAGADGAVVALADQKPPQNLTVTVECTIAIEASGIDVGATGTQVLLSEVKAKARTWASSHIRASVPGVRIDAVRVVSVLIRGE